MSTLPADFDALVYLELHPDVKAAGMDPAKHYLAFGMREGRAYKRSGQALLQPKLRGIYDYDGLRSVHNHDFMGDPAFLAAYQRGLAATEVDFRWYWRVHIGLWAARSAARLPGDFVECGVNRGFLSSAIMHDLSWDSTGRTYYLLDTFTGLDERYVSDVEKAGGVLDRNREELATGFYTTNLEVVRRNFAEWRNCRLVVGTIPETLAQIEASQVAFLHLDLNCTLPEVAAIEHLWARMPTGAIVLLDDYAYWGYQPQKDGMDAWAAQRQVPIASLPTGQGLIIKA
jgi:hypothetical protein